MKKLQLKKVIKTYHQQPVLSELNLDIDQGELVVFVGPSGCGKSTLLRMIAGLESITGGEILLNNKVINSLHPSERDVAMVFQSYALYPHMSVANNLGFPLKMAGVNSAVIKQKVQAIADSLQLTALLDRLPGALSGGQRQRVAIGRAIIRDPALCLFDEPLSNLDAKLRTEMRLYLKKLHQQLASTMIYVTHDQVEAMTLADKIVVMNQGRIEQVGSPETLYQQPANQFVASFIGSPMMNFLTRQDFQQLSPQAPLSPATATLGVRPNQVRVDAAYYDCEMRITVVEPLGHARLYYGELLGNAFVVESAQLYQTGDLLPLNLAASHLHSFDADARNVLLAGVAHAA